MKQLTDYKDAHGGETCYILGNGPSLRDVRLKDLEHVTFGTNRIYLSGYTPDYYVCVNDLVLKQFAEEIKALEPRLGKFVSNRYDIDDPEAIVLATTNPDPGFYSPEGSLWEGHTVTYVCMQLAYYMGFDQVILLGVDHDYGDNDKRPNLEIVSTEADPYHFDSNYFGPGTRWHAPDLKRSEFAYTIAKVMFEKDYREIVNASTRTKLDIFPLRNYDENSYIRVSAIVSAYNAKENIEGCLLDLINQDEHIEIVVVCQKNSPEHVETLDFFKQHEYDEWVILTTEDIPTVYRAWNLGIKLSKGKYITNANTDDRHNRQSMKILADILDARQDIDLVYHDQFVSWSVMGFDEFIDSYGGSKLVFGREEDKPGYFIWAEYDPKTLIHACYIGPQPMWRKTLHQRYGYFVDEYKVAGDYDFWLRIRGDNNMLHVPMFLGVYHANPDGLEMGNPREHLEELNMIQATNQDPRGVAFFPDKDYTKLTYSDEYTIVRNDYLVNLLEGVLEKIR